MSIFWPAVVNGDLGGTKAHAEGEVGRRAPEGWERPVGALQRRAAILGGAQDRAGP